MRKCDVLGIGRVGTHLEARVILSRVLEDLVELELIVGNDFGLAILLVFEGAILQAYDGVGSARRQCLDSSSASIRRKQEQSKASSLAYLRVWSVGALVLRGDQESTVKV